MSPLVTNTGPAPLSAAEVAEMKQHLAFLRRYKDALRLKLNATEDLLVNGQREPTDRGVCHHLLAKVDRAVVDGAVAREPLRSDVEARARMLAGAIRLTADVGVLVAYLETLAHVGARAEAAQAFAEVVQRIDFESLSGARLTRLLQVLVDTFVDHERVQVLFSLLASPGFQRAFDAAAPTFPPPVAEACAPLRAVHRSLVGQTDSTEPPALLEAGLGAVLSAPDPVLRGYQEPLRQGVLELALRSDLSAALGDRAASVLLASLPHQGRIYARLALRRAAQLLRRHADDRARVVLEDLRRAQPQLRTAERWLTATTGRRLGRVALTDGLPERGRLAAGWWLDGQRGVWLRSAAAPDAERLAREAALQAALPLPGVAPVVEHGTASGIPYVAVSAPGRPLLLEPHPSVDLSLALAAAIGRVFYAVALAGVVLPDIAPERFLQSTVLLTLGDFDGATPTDPTEAATVHAAQVARFARELVPRPAIDQLPAAVATALTTAWTECRDLGALIRALEAAARHMPRDAV